MKDAYYFSHDSNARNDPKILAVRAEFGMLGYGIFFAIIEMLREANAYQMLYNPKILAYDLREDEICLKKVCECFNLFTIKDNGDGTKTILSESLCKRMKRFEKIRVKRIRAGRKGGLASAKAKLNDYSTSKGKERKGNKGNKGEGVESSILEDKKQKPFVNYDPIIESKLSNIATKGMIKSVMREIPQEFWWKIDKYLKKRYPEDRTGITEAEREILKELECQTKLKD